MHLVSMTMEDLNKMKEKLGRLMEDIKIMTKSFKLEGGPTS